MELPIRPIDDRFTLPGRYAEFEGSIRRRIEGCNVPTLVVSAFDFRTRLGPYVFIDKALIPGAAKAVGSALFAAGFRNLRIVLQQWSPNVRPSMARLNGRSPELLLVSAMQIHSASAEALIRDAWRMGPNRPLILAGGAKAIYEPWDFFDLQPDRHASADIVVTGEEYVLLELIDRILAHRSSGETMLQAFQRVRRAGLLDDIPGLVYRPHGTPPVTDHTGLAKGSSHAIASSLVDTGIQRLVEDLDEIPLPFDALGLFERPHRRQTLEPRPLLAASLADHCRGISMVMTHGCKFHCSFCPIPAYNQSTFRRKSPQRLLEEVAGVAERSNLRFFFGTDDNFFNEREAAEKFFDTMRRGRVHGKPFRDTIFFATEGTEFDVFKNRDLLALGREAGLRAIWFGIEDMTAELIKKGQSPEKTKALFQQLLEQGIAPMPMMMHHDGQPLWTRKGLYGLLNQVRFLRQCGALSMQVTFLTPSPGAKDYGPTFERGMVMSRVAGQEVEDYQYDGNHCVATNAARPWRTQMNILLSYAAFYNPLNLLRALTQRDSLWDYRVRYQLLGMLGVLKSFNAFKGWIFRLMRGPIQRHTESPHRTLASPRRSPPAAHLLDSKSLDQVTSVSSS